MKKNIILSTDSYKPTHWVQYPPGTEKIHSYFECRGGEFKEAVMYGLQYYLKEYLVGKVFTMEDIDYATSFFTEHYGNANLFNRDGWIKMLHKYQGRLPIEIKALPEGTVVPVKNAMFTIENTDPEFYWLTNYLETMLCKVWAPIAVASQSRVIKSILQDYLRLTGCENIDEQLPFKFHDFGYRGVSSEETAAILGSAHLIGFMGTDTISAIEFIRNYYSNGSGMYGFSIPASEHSTITSWGRAHEYKAFGNMLEKYPTGLVACVSDSYDIYEACWKGWGGELKEAVLAREGTLVVRPDSGNPTEVVRKIINILGEYFGYTKNKYGYKILDPHIRIIQGDGVDRNSIPEILDSITSRDSLGMWAAENLAFGCGGANLQKLDRDTMKVAIKCSSAIINGEEIDVYKNPVTSPGKRSKIGKQKVVAIQDIMGGVTYQTCPENEVSPDWIEGEDQMKTVFRNGKLLIDQNFEDIRKRAELL